MPETTQRHWTFLNRLRQSDSFNAIDRSLMNDKNQLGVVLSSSVGPDKVSALMERVMKEMAQEFPGESITLDVYAPGHPLRKLGSAHLDGKTEEATYTPPK